MRHESLNNSFLIIRSNSVTLNPPLSASLDFIVGKLDVILKYEHVGFLDSILINK
jgi:hypothetical protein